MSENKHTPEPWKVLPLSEANNPFIVASEETGLSIADCYCPIGGNNEANARRIVACVNACAGTSTEELEEIVKHGTMTPVQAAIEIAAQRDKYAALASDYFDKLHGWMDGCLAAEKQRDELLAALEEATNPNGCSWHPDKFAKLISDVKSNGQQEKTPKTETPAIVFYPAGSLGEEVME